MSAPTLTNTIRRTEAWEIEGECFNMDGDWFFPTGTVPPTHPETRAAISACNRCPGRRQCAQYVIDAIPTAYPIRAGIWAGIRITDTHSTMSRSESHQKAYRALAAIATGQVQ